MARTLTAPQVAERLGVKLETVYAYVSRGYLSRQRGADGRASRFDPREVEALARRGRPRRSTHGPVVDVAIVSDITTIESHGLRFRGHDAIALSRRCAFEQVAQLLWSGTLPDGVPRWPVDPAPAAAASALAGSYLERIHLLVVQAVPRLGSGRDAATVGPALVGFVVDGLPVLAERVPRLHLENGAVVRASVAARLTARLTPRRPAPGTVALVNQALALLADHELAVSTLAVRVAASARADLVSAVSSGLGVLAGPLHGTASRHARALLDDVAVRGAVAAATAAASRGGALAGFGHRVYPGDDPRAVALLASLRRAFPGHPVVRHTEDLARVARERGVGRPNVDLALAALTSVAGMPADAGEAIFAVARMAGWVAHAAEEYQERPLRFRVRAGRPR